MLQQARQVLAARYEAAGRSAQGLAEGAGDDVDFVGVDAEVFGGAAASLAHDSEAVGVVDDQGGVVLAAELDDLGQRG